MKTNRNYPLVYGHRGASGYCPENTMIAFEKARDLGADGVELDVQMSKDGELVVIHDESVDRTSNGHGFVKDHTFQQLRQLNFNRTHPEYPWADIPTLEEVLKLIKEAGMIVNIELKNGIFDYPGLEKKVIELVRRLEMEDQVIYSSFNHKSCLRTHEIDPKAYVGFLYEDGFLNVPEYVKEHGGNALHPAFYLLQDPETIIKARELGLEINTWTVNDEQYMEGCCQQQLTGIITNYPDKALSIVKKYRNN